MVPCCYHDESSLLLLNQRGVVLLAGKAASLLGEKGQRKGQEDLCYLHTLGRLPTKMFLVQFPDNYKSP